MAKRGAPVCLSMTSILGTDTGLALVQMKIGELVLHVESKDARRIALNMLACAEAADMDKMIYCYLTDELGHPDRAASAAIAFFREFRAKQGDTVPGSEPT